MRCSPIDLLSSRNNQKGWLMLTGASGFLGSHLAAALLRDGYKLRVLCRAIGSANATERIRRVLAWHGMELSERVEVIEGDIGKPLLGLEPEKYAQLANSTAEFIHCASSTSFADPRKAQTEATNIEGTRRCVEFATAGSALHFHHISTAYVGGKAHPVCPEELLREPRGFNNPYEASKWEAEHVISQACTQSGLGFTIYRPSIIVGSSTSGRTLIFNAMYYVVRFYDSILQLVRRDYRENSGEHAKLLGAAISADNGVSLPMRVALGDTADHTLNLVPIDYVVNAFMAIFRSCAGPEAVYNIVATQPTTSAAVFKFVERYFNISGIVPVYGDGINLKSMNTIESNFREFADIYLPYMTDCRRFASEKTSAVLAANNVSEPQFDYEVFRKCVDYAIENRWRSPLKARSLQTTKKSPQKQSALDVEPVGI